MNGIPDTGAAARMTPDALGRAIGRAVAGRVGAFRFDSQSDDDAFYNRAMNIEFEMFMAGKLPPRIGRFNVRAAAAYCEALKAEIRSVERTAREAWKQSVKATGGAGQ